MLITEVKASTLKPYALAIVYAMSFVSIIGVIVLMQSYTEVYSSDMFDGGLSTLWYILFALGMALAVTIVHEGLHGLAFKVMGGDKVVFGVKKIKWLGVCFYASAPKSRFTKSQFMAIGLAPQILTVGLILLPLFVNMPAIISLMVMFMASMNLGGGCMDIYSCFIIARQPKFSLIEDTQDGFRVYGWDR
jgi:hypothetical protein